MGTGKILLQAFLQYPGLKSCLGIEICPSRFQIAATALQRLVALDPRRFELSCNDAGRCVRVIDHGVPSCWSGFRGKWRQQLVRDRRAVVLHHSATQPATPGASGEHGESACRQDVGEPSTTCDKLVSASTASPASSSSIASSDRCGGSSPMRGLGPLAAPVVAHVADPESHTAAAPALPVVLAEAEEVRAASNRSHVTGSCTSGRLKQFSAGCVPWAAARHHRAHAAPSDRVVEIRCGDMLDPLTRSQPARDTELKARRGTGFQLVRDDTRRDSSNALKPQRSSSMPSTAAAAVRAHAGCHNEAVDALTRADIVLLHTDVPHHLASKLLSAIELMKPGCRFVTYSDITQDLVPLAATMQNVGAGTAAALHDGSDGDSGSHARCQSPAVVTACATHARASAPQLPVLSHCTANGAGGGAFSALPRWHQLSFNVGTSDTFVTSWAPLSGYHLYCWEVLA